MPIRVIQRVSLYHGLFPGMINHNIISVLILRKGIMTRSLIDPESNSFPIIIRRGQKNLHGFQRISVLHLRNVQVGDLLTYTDLFRPDIIPSAMYLEHGSIRRKCLKGKLVILLIK